MKRLGLNMHGVYFLLFALFLISKTSGSRTNSKVTRDFSVETCPFGPGLLTCPANHQIWSCFCPTRNETVNINCSANEGGFCPEPVTNRIGVGKVNKGEAPDLFLTLQGALDLNRQKNCDEFIHQKCDPSVSKDPLICFCKAFLVKVKCHLNQQWTQMGGLPLNCRATTTGPSTLHFPHGGDREPKIQNRPTQGPAPAIAPFPGPDPENADHETKYNDEHDYLPTYNQQNFNGEFNHNRRPTSRPIASGRPSTGAFNNAGSSQNKPSGGCKKPIALIVALVILALAVAVLGVILVVITRRYKMALQQVINMNEIYSAMGMKDKNLLKKDPVNQKY